MRSRLQRPRVYLAGPDVFLPLPLLRAAAMKRICDRYGLEGVSPLDPVPGLADDPGGDPSCIARRNEAHIRGSDAILANLTPFRGPGADPGTVYEVGFGRALGPSGVRLRDGRGGPCHARPPAARQRGRPVTPPGWRSRISACSRT